MWNLKNKISEQTKQKQTHRYREQTDSCQRGGDFRGLGEKGEEIKQRKILIDTDNSVVVTRGKEWGVGTGERAQVQYMVTEEGVVLGGGHTV